MPGPRPTIFLVTVLLGGAACASSGHRVASPSTTTASTLAQTPSTTVSTPVTTVTTATTVRSTTTVKPALPTSPPTSATAVTVNAGDADNGKTITMAPGSTLLVTLGASNWTFSATSNPAVLSQTGATSQQRAPCIPGGTCGTTSARFAAHQVGTSQVIATRTYCGEAIQCTPATDRWAITVNVTGR